MTVIFKEKPGILTCLSCPQAINLSAFGERVFWISYYQSFTEYGTSWIPAVSHIISLRIWFLSFSLVSKSFPYVCQGSWDWGAEDRRLRAAPCPRAQVICGNTWQAAHALCLHTVPSALQAANATCSLFSWGILQCTMLKKIIHIFSQNCS